MACISPVTLRQGTAIINVPCNKCNFCLQDRRADWTFRILQELKTANTAHFITLTYEDDKQPVILDEETGELQPTLDKRDLQLFLKKLRNANDKSANPVNPFELEIKEWPTIKYYAVGEYGSNTFRPHYHFIVFNIKHQVLEQLSKLWSQGFHVIGNVQPASVHYVTKYVLNKDSGWEPLAKPFNLISKKLGANYLNTNGHEHKKALSTTVVNDRGQQRLPRYYKDKIFNYREKETIKQASIKSNDISYREAIQLIIDGRFTTDIPETYQEYKIRQKHEKIHTTKQSKITGL